MAPAVFPDNTVLINFVTVGRLDLLEAWLRGRGRWTQAVSAEAWASAVFHPGLANLHADGWLGEPIEIDEPGAVRDVERLRRNVFGGMDDAPRQHLGESQTCYLLTRVPEWAGSWWVSDDRDSLEFAKHKGITTLDTPGVAAHIVADGDLSAQQAYDMLRQMVDLGRDNVRLPKEPEDLLR